MYNKSVLGNGIRIVSEYVAHSRTVAFGVWVDAGSRDEHDLNNGCGHFVEHMLFKGTASRSAEKIAHQLDVLGGASNAFTSRENTCYYATVLDDHLDRLIDLVSDMFLRSTFDEEEVLRERQVILQEISMAEDQPDDLIHDLFSSLLWGRHSLGKTVLGSREVIAAMDSKKLVDHVATYYQPEKILIAAAGNVDHQHLVDMIGNQFNGLPQTKNENKIVRLAPTAQPVKRQLFSKPLEQVHAVIGTYGLPVNAPGRYALILLNIILGGNMSSRLFQEIREKRGLAYSVYSFLDSYIDSGYLGVYLGVDRQTVNESVEVVIAQIQRLLNERTSDEELRNAKDYAKSGLFLSTENMETRMTRIARNEFCFGRYFSYDEIAENIDAVSSEDILQVAKSLLSSDLAAAVLGTLEENEIDWKLL